MVVLSVCRYGWVGGCECVGMCECVWVGGGCGCVECMLLVLCVCVLYGMHSVL